MYLLWLQRTTCSTLAIRDLALGAAGEGEGRPLCYYRHGLLLPLRGPSIRAACSLGVFPHSFSGSALDTPCDFGPAPSLVLPRGGS